MCSFLLRVKEKLSLNNKFLPLWLLEDEYSSAKEKIGQNVPWLMSGTDWCLVLCFSQHLLLSKTYTCPRRQASIILLFSRWMNKRGCRRLFLTVLGTKPRGQTTCQIYIKCIQIKRKCIFWRCFERLLSNLVATQHAAL